MTATTAVRGRQGQAQGRLLRFRLDPAPGGAALAIAAGAAETLEAVEDQVEPPGELDGVVVPGLGELRRDLDEVRVVLEAGDGRRSCAARLRRRCRGSRSPCRVPAGRSRRCRRPGANRRGSPSSKEKPACAGSPSPRRGCAGSPARDGATPSSRSPSCGASAPPASRSPGGASRSASRGLRRELDLAEDDVDHAVEELVLVGDVLVERHRHDAELLREAAHAERLRARPRRRARRRLRSTRALLSGSRVAVFCFRHRP